MESLRLSRKERSVQRHSRTGSTAIKTGVSKLELERPVMSLSAFRDIPDSNSPAAKQPSRYRVWFHAQILSCSAASSPSHSTLT
jgi:hypothetical protein